MCVEYMVSTLYLKIIIIVIIILTRSLTSKVRPLFRLWICTLDC